MALVVIAEMPEATTGVGARFMNGITEFRKSSAGSSRTVDTRLRIAWIRSAGSATPDGAEKNAPVKRLPPIGSSSRRTEYGTLSDAAAGPGGVMRADYWAVLSLKSRIV